MKLDAREDRAQQQEKSQEFNSALIPCKTRREDIWLNIPEDVYYSLLLINTYASRIISIRKVEPIMKLQNMIHMVNMIHRS